MYKATFELLEALTNHAKAQLHTMRSGTEDPTLQEELLFRIQNLNGLLNKAQHELEGGP